jgi:hypothetical protein
LARVTPIPLDQTQTSIGFSNMKILNVNGKLYCSFRRVKNINFRANYFNLASNRYYLLFAYGRIDSLGIIGILKI